MARGLSGQPAGFSRRQRLLRALLTAALACLAARPARAQEQPEALIRQGVELRRHNQDALAQGYFKRAYAIAHTPRAAAQLGLVEQALGSFIDAEQHLTEALENPDPWVDQNRSTLEQSRALVRTRLFRVQTRGLPADTTVTIGHHAPVAVASDGVVWLPPGSTALTFAAPERRPVTTNVGGVAGATVVLEVELAGLAGPAAASSPRETAVPRAPGAAPAASSPPALAPPAPAPAASAPPTVVFAHPEPDTGHGRRVAGVAVGGAGLALASAGIITYLVGASKQSAIEHDAAFGRPYNTANGDYQTLGDVGIGLAVAGAVAIAGGATLYLLNREPQAEAGGAAVSVGYLPGGGGMLRIGGRF